MNNTLEEVNEKNSISLLISELDNHVGLNNAKKILQDIEKYYKIYRLQTEKRYKDYNIIISVKSNYSLYMELIEIIRQIYVSLGIVSKEAKCIYINLNNNSSNFLLGNIKSDEEIVILDMLNCEYYYSSIKYKVDIAMKEEPRKIYIILENARNGKTNSLFINDFQWYIDIDKISTEDKENYIRDFLQKHKIKSKDSWISNLAKEPYYNVKNTLTNALVQCKIDNKWEILNTKTNTRNSSNDCKKTGLEELNNLIGLKEVKEQIIKIVNYLKICKDRNNMPMLHMCFNGNPGTGKTTVARMLGRIFAEEGFFSKKDNFVEVQRADLIGKYVGHTAPLTKEQTEKARGGILFIDEAYTLASYIRDEAGNDYGAECIATLIKEMEDHKDDLCVILAGYTKEMTHLLETNPGFDSRIQFKIDFPNYSKEELMLVFEQLCKKEKYKVSSKAKKLLLEHFEVSSQKNNFSNARYVRSIFEKIKIEQANRAMDNFKNTNNILELDVKKVIGNIKEEPIKKEAKKRND